MTIVLFLAGCPLFAATIFSNLTAGNTYNATLGGLVVAGPTVDPTNPTDPTTNHPGQSVAQLFTSPGTFDVTQIDLGLVYQSGFTNSALVSLWTDVAGQPGSKLGSWLTSPIPAVGTLSGQSTAPMSGGQITTGITGVRLYNGQSYFLEAGVNPNSIDPSGATPATELTWFQETTTLSVGYYSSYSGTDPTAGPWSHGSYPEGAYAVFGNAVTTTPEPSTLLLMAGSIALFRLAGLRKPSSD